MSINKARMVSEVQDFTRGGDPYEKLGIGKYSSPDEMGEWAIEQLEGYGIHATHRLIDLEHPTRRVEIILYDALANYSMTWDATNGWSFWHHAYTLTPYDTFDELLYNLIERNFKDVVIDQHIKVKEQEIKDIKKCKKYLEDHEHEF